MSRTDDAPIDQGRDRNPRDTLDRDPKRTEGGMPIPDDYAGDGTDSNGQKNVEDRPRVGQVSPDDYPDPAR